MSHSKVFVPLVIASMGACASVHAQSSLQLYGVVDIAAGSFQYSGAKGSAANARLTKVEGNQMITSFIGLKGTEVLGGGLKAGFVIESFLRPDSGASGRYGSSDPFWSRAANVWVQGGLGQLTLGRQGSLLFVNTLQFNPLGAAFGLSPAIRLTFGGTKVYDKSDSGWSNALTYQTRNLSGFTGAVQVQFGEDASKDERTSYALSARYVSGPFAIGGAWQTMRSNEAPKPKNLTAGQAQNFGMLGVSYDAGCAKFFGQYGAFANKGFSVIDDNIDTRLYQVGAAVPVTRSGKLLVSYGQSKEEAASGSTPADVKHSILTLAYDHYLSKRTDVYAAFMLDDEDKANSKKGYTYTVGVRHAF